jgi:small-conductance mechanosensitive channel
MANPWQMLGIVVDRLLQPSGLLQLAVIASVIGCSLWLAGLVRQSISAQPPTGDALSMHVRQARSVIAPHLISLLLLAAAVAVMQSIGLVSDYVLLAVKLTGLLLLVRLATYLLRTSLGARWQLKGWSTGISLVIWAFLSLHLLGWGDEVIAVLDGIGVKAGNARISVWSVTKLLLTVSLFVIAALWISRWLEGRLLKVDALAPNMRIGIAKFAQAFLVGLSLMAGLNAAGMDLTTLNVLTGAIGIGLGFGLQSIAANFVSGFVLLMDRSIKPGDVISFTGTTGTTTEGFGWVEELRGRYVVVRDRDGVATLVPNQHLINNPVINWSYTDPRVRLKLPIRISYKDDPEVAMRLLIEATTGHRRVIHEPPPVARLMGFGETGIDLELRFWIPDPQEGVNNVRSDVNRSIWRLFRDNGITIPVAQREIRVEMLPTQSGSGAAGRD